MARSIALSVFAGVLLGVNGHQNMQKPIARQNSMVNGILFGKNPPVTEQRNGFPTQDNNRNPLVQMNPLYKSRPCGGSGLANFEQNIEFARGNPNEFDFSLPPPSNYVTESYTADSEVTITIGGYMHPGLISARLCIPPDNCMDTASYEKNVLGYWWNEGVGSPGTDIYSGKFEIKVKMPNAKCDRCVLQVAFDVYDARSYVSCADISLRPIASTPAVPTAVSCNGHPYCNCTLTNGPAYGLHASCPIGLSSGYSEHAMITKKQLSAQQFCDFCVSNACPRSCGGTMKGTYNGENTKGGVHASKLPAYVLCDATHPCNCPGCAAQRFPLSGGDGGGGVVPVTPSSAPSPSTAPPPPTSDCATPLSLSVSNNGYASYTFSHTQKQDNPTLSLVRGRTYKFAVATPGHPFFINTKSGTGRSNAYTGSAIASNGVDTGTITFTAPLAAAFPSSTMYYNCELHADMAGTIKLIDAAACASPPPPSSAPSASPRAPSTPPPSTPPPSSAPSVSTFTIRLVLPALLATDSLLLPLLSDLTELLPNVLSLPSKSVFIVRTVIIPASFSSSSSSFSLSKLSYVYIVFGVDSALLSGRGVKSASVAAKLSAQMADKTSMFALAQAPIKANGVGADTDASTDTSAASLNYGTVVDTTFGTKMGVVLPSGDVADSSSSSSSTSSGSSAISMNVVIAVAAVLGLLVLVLGVAVAVLYKKAQSAAATNRQQHMQTAV